jgi:hypothetical protein
VAISASCTRSSPSRTSPASSNWAFCRTTARVVEHVDVAAAEIQDRRAGVTVPGDRPLHDYANLYFDARNPMMSVRRTRHAELCVLRMSCCVLDLPDIVVTDGNASSDYIRFGAAAHGLDFIDRDLVFATWWTDSDPNEQAQEAGALRRGPRAASRASGLHHGRQRLRSRSRWPAPASTYARRAPRASSVLLLGACRRESRTFALAISCGRAHRRSSTPSTAWA